MAHHVAVTGATGFVGRSIVRALLEGGHHVRALTRSREKALSVLPQSHPDRLRVVVGDALDPAVLGDLVRGATAVIHLVGIIREVRGPRGGMPQTFRRMHVDATRAIIQEAQAAGVRRYLHMSALGVSDAGVAEYQRTKFEAEHLVRRSDLDWTIFRPGLIHGPDGEFTQMAVSWATGTVPPFIFIPYFKRHVPRFRVPLDDGGTVDPVVAPVFVDDVAKAFVTALDTPGSVGEIYNLAGPERLPWPTLLRHIRDNSHGNQYLSPWGIPGHIAGAIADVAAFVGVGSLLPHDGGMARMGSQDSVADTTKAQKDLGITLAPFRSTFSSYASAFGH